MDEPIPLGIVESRESDFAQDDISVRGFSRPDQLQMVGDIEAAKVMV